MDPLVSDENDFLCNPAVFLRLFYQNMPKYPPALLGGDEWPTLSPGRLCHNQREATSVARRNRRSGDEALERKPFIAQLEGSKPMKTVPFLRRPITHNFKQPHSKAEEADCLFRRNLPSLIITTQSLKGEESFLEN